LLYEIKTSIPMDVDLKITVNGTDLPKSKIESDCWVYGFIRPGENVEVAVEVVAKDN